MRHRNNSEDELASLREDWDRRIQADPLLWMSGRTLAESAFFESGTEDLQLLLTNIEAPNGVALDYGCGTGRMLPAASSRFRRVFAYDFSPEAVHRAAQVVTMLSNVVVLDPLPRLSEAAIPTPPDVIFSYGVCGIMPAQVVASALTDCARAQREGGHLVIQLYIGAEQIGSRSDSLAVRCYEPARLEAALAAAGYGAVAMRELIHPELDVSDSAANISATIVHARRSVAEPQPDNVVHRQLVRDPETECPSAWPGALLEFRLATTSAEACINAGYLARAKQLLDFALERYPEEHDLLKPILARLKERLQSDRLP
ncbi:MAG: methyltransferase domain-containing protein [Bdellovibrionales bacterium]|nr:methyltransferase domain-containing protein [Bdellovibrionales bacterium]